MKIGSACSGAGGLDMAVEAVFGGRTVWHAETDAAASRVLAARWNVPNHGDLTATDWSTVEPIDIFTAGWPCQPWSAAGKQKGAADERAIWPSIARAIRELRPRYVFLENVSAVIVLGELARAVGDLAQAGYDAQWVCLRASDVGAPHRRERVFVLATDTEGTRRGVRHTADLRPTDREVDTPRNHCDGDGPVELLPTPRGSRGASTTETTYALGGTRSDANRPQGEVLLPTPTAQAAKHDADDRGPGTLDDFNLWSVAARIGRGELLPTPTSRDGKGANQRGDDTCLTGALLPTPAAADGQRGQDYARANRDGSGGDDLITAAIKAENTGQWGKYEPAIRRWESVTRPAPAPTEPNTKGNPRLSAAFSEWMLGWPAGWVTDIDISRNDQLRIIGNGVVPQQATAALRWLLSVSEAAA